MSHRRRACVYTVMGLEPQSQHTRITSYPSQSATSDHACQVIPLIPEKAQSGPGKCVGYVIQVSDLPLHLFNLKRSLVDYSGSLHPYALDVNGPEHSLNDLTFILVLI